MSFIEVNNDTLFSINIDNIIEVVKLDDGNAYIRGKDDYNLEIPEPYEKFMQRLSLVTKVIKEDCQPSVYFYSYED